MRIIAGKNKGMTLTLPKNDFRPTMSNRRETLFNILQFDIEGARVLDLFAGCGALGLEAHSRGASRVVFVDDDALSVEAVKANCAKMKCGGEIIQSHYRNALSRLKEKFDLIFVDPPYEKDYYYDCLRLISGFGLADENCIVLCEHKSDLPLPQKIDNLEKYKSKVMGKVTFTFYRRVEN